MRFSAPSTSSGNLPLATALSAKITRLQIRIGLHLGDIIVEDGDIYGDGVNVAARLKSIAEPGGIVLSKQVHDHIGTNVPVRFIPLGEQSVKNISRPIQAYRVDFTPDPTSLQVIRFRDFELDISRFELRQAGKQIAIEPQVFDLLVFLARNSDRTVTKEEIFTAIWGDRIVSDAALSSQIKAARRAVGDDGVVAAHDRHRAWPRLPFHRADRERRAALPPPRSAEWLRASERSQRSRDEAVGCGIAVHKSESRSRRGLFRRRYRGGYNDRPIQEPMADGSRPQSRIRISRLRRTASESSERS